MLFKQGLMLCPCSANNKKQVDMTALFTNKDVAHLRKLGWPLRINQIQVLGDLHLNDARLLEGLVEMGVFHKHMQEKYGQGGSGEYTGLMSDIRDGVSDGTKLLKAFHALEDRHTVVASLYNVNDELTALRTAVTALVATTINVKKRAGSRHDPKFYPLQIAAKRLIELWAYDTGAPPTPVHSTKSRPAGKCFRHVLNKLQEAYGGELAESVLEKLCKKARAKYNLEKRTQKL